MPAIYKRGRVWQIQYRENGRLVERSLRTHSKRLAELKKAEIELRAWNAAGWASVKGSSHRRPPWHRDVPDSDAKSFKSRTPVIQV